MKYMGSKARVAKQLLPIILANRKPNQYYVEPFVGGANMIDKVTGNRIANDTNQYLIALLDAVSRGWQPPSEISNEQYLYAKENQSNLPPEYVGFVGLGSSYGGKWFGGYARGLLDNGTARNYTDESKRNILKQAAGLSGIRFYSGSYDMLSIPANSIIYCDPPYASTTSYRDRFDSEAFWRWCDKMVLMGHEVYVSEYQAPEPWQCVWAKEVSSSLTGRGSKQSVERLFTRSL